MTSFADRSGNNRPRGSGNTSAKGQERPATANGKNRNNSNKLPLLPRRGRNFSGDSSDIYPFHLDGPPAYGEVVPEPGFVTPIIGGMAYYYGEGQYNAAAATAAAQPSTSSSAEDVLKANIKTQIEYYFSRENLRKDFFLRRKMDNEGYLPATLVASFNRVRSLTNDVTFIMQAVQDSDIVQVTDGKFRPKDDPTSWPLTSDQPDPVISPKPEAEIDNAADKEPAK